MNAQFLSTIRKATGAREVFEIELIQELWSGYGKILRYGLLGTERSSVVIKHVRWPNQLRHPRGWNNELSHQRKLKSYQVEMAWYQYWSDHCARHCRIPQCLALETCGDEVLMVLEDLDAAGFPLRREAVNWTELSACLRWLANFHATFMGKKPRGLWEQGTYWHLQTRPDELAALTDLPLKHAAQQIDQRLQESPFQTMVHGDAKLANFCFSPQGSMVAAVDFQYVGGGCGMKDVAYFIGSCLDEKDCARLEARLLDSYFAQLRLALKAQQPMLDGETVEQDWRSLYPVAWTDFHRFLKGWSPGHWKIHDYSEKLAREVVKSLSGETRDKH